MTILLTHTCVQCKDRYDYLHSEASHYKKFCSRECEVAYDTYTLELTRVQASAKRCLKDVEFAMYLQENFDRIVREIA